MLLVQTRDAQYLMPLVVCAHRSFWFLFNHLSLTRQKRRCHWCLMQMQKLRKPPHSHILCPLQRLLLLYIALIALNGETVVRSGEILIVVFEIQARDYAVRVRFQFWCQLRVVLRGDDLHRDADGVDFLLLEEGGVRGRNAVD